METVNLPRNPVVQTVSMREFKSGVDELLAKRSYFVSQVLPQLIEGQDFYTIKGKKSLAKGGSEKIASIYGYTASFIQDNETMRAFDVKGLIAFICDLYKGNQKVGQGRGASTLSKNDNDPNKTIKMSQKSAYIDAVIRASGLSDIFTQDLDTIPTQAISEIQTQEEEKVLQDSITSRQKDLLISLLYQNVHEEEQREKWIASLDELTKGEASEQIQSFIEPR